jgi:hypothetical protein
MAPSFRYTIEYFRDAGDRVGTVAIEPDWSAALECAQFLGIRRGTLPARSATPAGVIEPVWHADAGAPAVGAIKVVMAGSGAAPAAEVTLPRAYFRALAEHGADQLVERGDLARGESFQYLVCAWASDRPDAGARAAGLAPAAGPDAWGVEEVATELALERRDLAPLLASSMPCGSPPDDDAHVIVPQPVIAETLEASARSGDVETGGVLIGHLRRTLAGDDVFVEITAQIPALHAESQNAKLTFTAETWAAASAAIDLRRRGEIMLGWWHYHPNWCAKCPAESQARCALRHDFFSGEDVHLHRTCFPRAYHVAMLVSAHAAGPSVSMYGWRRGAVEARQFQVLDPIAAAECDARAADDTRRPPERGRRRPERVARAGRAAPA